MVKKKILKDTREQQGWDFSETDEFSGMSIATLKTGDYTIEGMEDIVCIERKGNVSELAHNFVEKRFIRELERMNHPHAYILMEFSLRDLLNYPLGSGIPKSKLDKIKITGKFLMSKIVELELQYKVRFIFCGNSIDAQNMALTIMKKVLLDSSNK